MFESKKEKDVNLRNAIAKQEEISERHDNHVKSCLVKVGLHEYSSQSDKRVVRNDRKERKRITKNQRKEAIKNSIIVKKQSKRLDIKLTGRASRC